VDPVILIILWAIGISMIGLAGLIYLPRPVIATVSIAIIALHNLLDPVSASRFGGRRGFGTSCISKMFLPSTKSTS
jgi:hypothetical protein